MAKGKYVKIPSNHWVEINPDSMPDNVKKLWTARVNAFSKAYEAQAAFEKAFSEGRRAKGKLPEGYDARIGYNFGKLSTPDVSLAPTVNGKPDLTGYAVAIGSGSAKGRAEAF